MTPQQVKWMQDNPEFQFVGRTGGMTIFTKQTCIRPDGTSYLLQRGHRPNDGEIHVGIRKIVEAGKGLMADPRIDTSSRSPGR